MRYSTEPGNSGTDDRVPQPRGLAMKVFNVEGEMFEAGADIRTQDIE
jgi:catalase